MSIKASAQALFNHIHTLLNIPGAPEWLCESNSIHEILRFIPYDICKASFDLASEKLTQAKATLKALESPKDDEAISFWTNRVNELRKVQTLLWNATL